MRFSAAWLGWALIELGDRLSNRFATSALYRIGSRLEVWGTDYRSRQRGPMNPDDVYDDVSNRFPNIMKRLGE